jgi:hypothetical protein
MGYQNAFIVAACVSLAQFALAFVFIRYGKQMRRNSAEKYARYVQKAKAVGLAH